MTEPEHSTSKSNSSENLGDRTLPKLCQDVLIAWVQNLDSEPVKVEGKQDLEQMPPTGKIIVEGDATQLSIHLAPFCGGHTSIASRGRWLQNGEEVPYRNRTELGGGSYKLEDGKFEILGRSESLGPIADDIRELVTNHLNSLVES